MDKITLTLKKDKETKNTIRYQEVKGDDGKVKIGPIYFQKDGFNGKTPPDEFQIEIPKF